MKGVCFLAGAMLALLTACGKKQQNGEAPLARAYDKYLYPSDVKDIYYAAQDKADSARVLNVYINNWSRQVALAHFAGQNLDEAEKNVDQELDAYRSSLLIHRYDNKLLLQQLDTITTEAQLRAYYNSNKSSFALARNIVQLNFVKIEEDNRALPDIKRLFLSSRFRDKKELVRLCEKNAGNYYLDDDTWLDFSEVQKELPIRQYDEEHFLRNNKFLEIREGRYIYLILIKAYRTKTSLSSFDFEKERLHDILLNQRKTELLRKMEHEVMKKAEENKDIEKYTIQ